MRLLNKDNIFCGESSLNYKNHSYKIEWQYYLSTSSLESYTIYQTQTKSDSLPFSEIIRLEKVLKLSNAEKVNFWLREYDGVNWKNKRPLSGFRIVTNLFYYGDDYSNNIKNLIIIKFLNNPESIVLMRFKGLYLKDSNDRLKLCKSLSKVIIQQ